MKKMLWIVLMVALLGVSGIAVAQDVPPPICDDQGTFLPKATALKGNLKLTEPVYLLSAQHGWKPKPELVMAEGTKNGVPGYFSKLVIPQNGKYHPAQPEGSKIHYLEVETAWPDDWQNKPFLVGATFINK